jgi:hypothetical protein
MTHGQLCEAATRWLTGTMRCNIALSGIASTAEIPDAIGWSTSGKNYGSLVVECKMSLSDFRVNKKKYERWIPPELKDYPQAIRHAMKLRRMTEVQAIAAGWAKELIPGMGNWRYFLVPDNLIPLAKVWDRYPGYGLLYLRRGRVTIIQKAKENSSIDLAAEIRLLQFALVHVRENLLYAGCSVDMDMLTKHPMTNRKGRSFTWWVKGFRSGYGIEVPMNPSEFLKGEMR